MDEANEPGARVSGCFVCCERLAALSQRQTSPTFRQLDANDDASQSNAASASQRRLPPSRHLSIPRETELASASLETNGRHEQTSHSAYDWSSDILADDEREWQDDGRRGHVETLTDFDRGPRPTRCCVCSLHYCSLPRKPQRSGTVTVKKKKVTEYVRRKPQRSEQSIKNPHLSTESDSKVADKPTKLVQVLDDGVMAAPGSKGEREGTSQPCRLITSADKLKGCAHCVLNGLLGCVAGLGDHVVKPILELLLNHFLNHIISFMVGVCICIKKLLHYPHSILREVLQLVVQVIQAFRLVEVKMESRPRSSPQV